MRRARLLSTLLICFGLTACRARPGQPTTTTPPPATQVVVTTRMLALRGPDQLTLNDGCLRAGDHVLVWPPEFSVSVEANQVTVTDGYAGERAVWHVGDAVWLGGGEIRRASIDAEAGQRWLGDCEGGNAYWLVGGINVTTPITATPPAPTATVAPTPRVTATPLATQPGLNFRSDCVEGNDPELTAALPASSFDPDWKHYVHLGYGFSVEIPSDWRYGLDEHFLCLKPAADPGVVLVIGFRALSENETIMRTGVGAGDLIPRGTIVVLGQDVTRYVLVYQGQEVSVVYNVAEIQSPPLAVAVSLDFHDGRSYQEPAVGLPAALQATADQIVASLAFDQVAPSATPISTAASATTIPLPSTTVPAPTATEPPPTITAAPATASLRPPTVTRTPTGTASPTACAHAWFMANPSAGCPDQPAVVAQTIAQHFERGLLLWRAVPDTYGSQIYAFFGDGQWPAWNPTNDQWRQGQPESDRALVPPAGFYQPVRGFGLFWRDANFNPAGAARDRLGWALEPESALGERALQCRVQGDWAAGCFLGGPDDQILLVEGNSAWSMWTGPTP
jgi:hypothetical protein